MKLKEGMYVRFNDLTNYNKNNIVMIDKIKFISEVMCGLEETLSITFEKYNEDVLKKDIIKASYSIIDLIEVGDYVNGNKVIRIETSSYLEDKNVKIIVCCGDDDYYSYYNEDIKSILTKEQFESMAYEVEE